MVLSEAFHKEDNVQLTEAEQRQAEQMREDEQLRRRDPVAYQARMLERQNTLLGAAPTYTYFINTYKFPVICLHLGLVS